MATETTQTTTTPATKPSVPASPESASAVNAETTAETTKETSPPAATEAPKETPAPGIRLKAKVENGVTEVKALITHPMETGLRFDPTTSKPVPPHFIEEVKCEHNGQVIISANWGIGISKDPYWAFKFKGGKVGDKIKLSWQDNQGKTDSMEVEIEE